MHRHLRFEQLALKQVEEPWVRRCFLKTSIHGISCTMFANLCRVFFFIINYYFIREEFCYAVCNPDNVFLKNNINMRLIIHSFSGTEIAWLPSSHGWQATGPNSQQMLFVRHAFSAAVKRCA